MLLLLLPPLPPSPLLLWTNRPRPTRSRASERLDGPNGPGGAYDNSPPPRGDARALPRARGDASTRGESTPVRHGEFIPDRDDLSEKAEDAEVHEPRDDADDRDADDIGPPGVCGGVPASHTTLAPPFDGGRGAAGPFAISFS